MEWRKTWRGTYEAPMSIAIVICFRVDDIVVKLWCGFVWILLSVEMQIWKFQVPARWKLLDLYEYGQVFVLVLFGSSLQ